jgi:hypothetical protein
MRTNLSHTWPGKAILVKSAKGTYTIIHLRELPYNKFETETYLADKNGVAISMEPTAVFVGDLFDATVNRCDIYYKPRKPKSVASAVRKPKSVSKKHEFIVDEVKIEDEPLVIVHPPLTGNETGSEGAIHIDASSEDAPFKEHVGEVGPITITEKVLSSDDIKSSIK